MTGNLWKVSDLLDETDIRFAQKHFFDLRSGYEYYGLTEKVLMRTGKSPWMTGAMRPNLNSASAAAFLKTSSSLVMEMSSFFMMRSS